jgi:hypothetical protein
VCETLNYYSYKTSFRGATVTAAHTISWQNQANRLTSQVILYNLQWTAAQEGNCVSGCSGYLNKVYDGDYSYPASGTVYTTPPPWGMPNTQVLSDMVAGNYQCINQVLEWKRGSGIYYLSNPDLCVPQLP